MALQLRRGTNQQRLGLTPVEGEMIYVTDNILATISVTSIDISADQLSTTTPHGLSIDQQVKYTGATLNGLTKDQVYFVKTAPSITEFSLSTSLGGGVLNITGTYTVPLVFAKTPCNASGAPLGYDVSPLWAGDGFTVGGNPAGAILLDELRDVVITAPAVEGEFLWYNGTSWVNENETTVDETSKTLSLTRRYTSAVKEYESPLALRLNGRVTNVTNDNTDDAGPSLRFERSSGTQSTKTYVSGGAIGAFTVTLNNVTGLVVGNKVTGTGLPQGNGALITIIAGNQLTLDTAFTVQAAGTYTIGAPVGFGQLAFEYFGTTDVHKFKVTTSIDDYLESPTDVYPGTSTLIVSDKNGTQFNGGSVVIDAINDRIGVNDTSPDYDITVYKPSNPNFALVNAEREFLLTNDASNDQLSFAWGGSNRLQFQQSNNDQSFPVGRLGVGLTNPTSTLHVSGTTNLTSNLTVDSGVLFVDASTNRVGINNITPNFALDVAGSAYISSNLDVIGNTSLDSGTLYVNASTNRVGLNTNTPTATLDIRGGLYHETATSGERAVIQYNNSDASTNSLLFLRKNYGAGTYTTGDGSGLAFMLDSDSQTLIQHAIIDATYDATASPNKNTAIRLRTNTVDNTTGPFTTAASFTPVMATLNGDLIVEGATIGTGANDVILTIERTTTGTSGTFRRALILNSPTTGTPSLGYGTAMSFTGQTSASNFEDAGYIAVQSTDNTGGSEDFKMAFGLMQNGASYADKMTLESNGNLTATSMVASSATFGNIDINTTNGQIDTNGGLDLTLDSDGGDVIVNDRLTVNVTLQTPTEDTVTSGTINIGSAITKFTTGASGQTSTLGDANFGQFKTLYRSTSGAGAMVVTVTKAGWKGGASGTITFGNQGDSCFLQYMNDGRWYILGSYDVVIA